MYGCGTYSLRHIAIPLSVKSKDFVVGSVQESSMNEILDGFINLTPADPCSKSRAVETGIQVLVMSSELNHMHRSISNYERQ
jgi:hypothetical protein